jgi:nitroreductase
MDFKQLILSRRTVHNYKPTRVDDELVQEALRLSLWSPNHRLTFPWFYSEIGPEARARLADLAVQLKSQKAPLSDVKEAAVRASVLNPSHLIALGRKRADEPSAEHEDFATLAGSVVIASLFLWEKGVATKWSTGGWTLHPKTYEVLGADPKEVRLEGCLMIGVADIVPHVSKRPDLKEILKKTP